MTDERYRVVFKGQLADHATLDTVTTNLTPLYKNNSAKANAILSSSNAVIKKDIDLATCQKIQSVFEKAGAICSIEKQKAAADGLDNLTMVSADLSGSLESASPSGISQNTATPSPPSRPPDLPHQRQRRQTVRTSSASARQALSSTDIKRPDEKYCRQCGQLINIAAKTCFRCGAQAGRKLSKTALLLITFFTGGIGGHKFYLGKTMQGIMYLVFFWTFIPGLIALIEFVIFATAKEKDLQNKFPEAGGKESVILLVVFGFVGIIATLGILAAIAIPNFLAYRNKAHFVQIEKELKELATQQEFYFVTHGRYTLSLDELDFTRQNNQIDLEIISAGQDCFLARGTFVGTSAAATIDCNGRIERESLAVANQAGQDTVTELNSVISEEGYFSISFPGEPTDSSQEISTALGPITLVIYSYETRNGAYLASYSDYPVEVVEQSDPDELLNEAQAGAVGNVRGQLISSRDIDIASYPGKEIVLKIPKSQSMPPGGIGKARFYLVDNRLYQVLSIHAGSKLSAATDQFLDSFDLMHE